jgi:hypothetical protein
MWEPTLEAVLVAACVAVRAAVGPQIFDVVLHDSCMLGKPGDLVLGGMFLVDTGNLCVQSA